MSNEEVSTKDNEEVSTKDIVQDIAKEISVALCEAIKDAITGSAAENLIIERVTTKEAAEELLLSERDVRSMIKHGKLPIGVVDKKEGSEKHNVVIYRGLLDRYKAKIANVQQFE